MAITQMKTKTFASDSDQQLLALCDLVASELGIPREQITPETVFAEQLGADSLDLLDLVNAVEDQLEVNVADETLAEIKTVRDLAALVQESSKN